MEAYRYFVKVGTSEANRLNSLLMQFSMELMERMAPNKAYVDVPGDEVENFIKYCEKNYIYHEAVE